KDEENAAQENRKLDGANAEVPRNRELARTSVLEPEHNHSQGNKDEAPDHSEGIRFSQDNHVPAADQDSEELQEQDQRKNSGAGAETRMGLEEPIGQDAVLGHAVKHAVGADDRRIDRSRQDQEADHHHKRF